MPEPPTDTETVEFEVWRQDDNGHRFLVKVVAGRAEAVREVEALEALGHKQTYWFEPREMSRRLT